jgi:hypothetical protein
MNIRRSASAIVLLLTPMILAAENAVVLSSDDLYFMSELAKKPLPDRDSESMTLAPTRLCGFQIRGNHKSHANPRVEWDFNIDQIAANGGWVAGVTAGAFDVTGHDRKARPPITDLTFSIEGHAQPISARIVGTPNADNGIKAFLEADAAGRLLTAFSDDSHLITIALKYSDGSTEMLQIRGWHDWRKFSGGKNTLLNECLRGYTLQPELPRPVP